ncbi:hypothetical protein TNIN_452681 [Trichonephila inaurata madagascariensis]|uniref:Uncharacterized protein n=1 Tax=Trichonephila inaurata madagascariensis TaxID=2747483 RepID=A0A8X6YY05_9ARAC|nr:hypothetical protein TNIN_452681 [Trichonephila inaurata madagascariensis]
MYQGTQRKANTYRIITRFQLIPEVQSYNDKIKILHIMLIEYSIPVIHSASTAKEFEELADDDDDVIITSSTTVNIVACRPFLMQYLENPFL